MDTDRPPPPAMNLLGWEQLSMSPVNMFAALQSLGMDILVQAFLQFVTCLLLVQASNMTLFPDQLKQQV